ncbi:MAG: DUF488 domain-containing protein [Syntrophales bacterium]|jgi:uncharacterized protein YeaO (DUF488 family)
MLKIKRVYDQVSPGDGKRILVDRLWPRGIKKEAAAIDEWLKDIAPSTELRKWYSHDPAKWGEFKQRYKIELKDRMEIIDRLRQESKTRAITLLFSAKATELNNAVALKEFVEQ